MAKNMKRNDAITLRDGQAAINVKVYSLPNSDASEAHKEIAFSIMQDMFWADVTDLAHQRGYAGVFSEGRSGGWCVPYKWSKPNVKQHYHKGYSQGPDVGYPLYPDVAHVPAERERFRGFQRAVRRLLVTTINERYLETLQDVTQSVAV